jgi:glycosyltransferase involved in cell wall biosynthesis
MKIWHVGALPSPQTVDGITTTAWLVAREQALIGHQVSLLLQGQPDKAALALAEQTGLKLVAVPAGIGRFGKVLKPLVHFESPQILHMHRVFRPRQAVLEKYLMRNRIPCVVTTHGAIHFQQSRMKRSFYARLVEKPKLYMASAVTVVAPPEETVVRTLLPNYEGIIRWVPNPVDVFNLEGNRWKGNINWRRLVFMGRFHVVQKGIDILVDIARFLPDVEFHLYGTDDPKTRRSLKRLQRRLSPNVYFHGPVFGAEKARVLCDASLYIQMSRWEGFPISVAEAMYVGVPCALADTLFQAELFRQQNLGPVLPPDPKEAAVSLSEILAQPDRLQLWSERAQAYAQAHFVPRTVALSYLKLYEEVLDA